ncbi:tRNA (adenosine(37)-N6)-dimethylallyltransferase MiaA [Algoriphagus zhangzhouensis]|uniref:tRNA dimethylallyltransferase n=1 Tax=Algoriphagus zhangzhouensis TaxID=1073327 RepID=A0A1M7Z3G3_9BACT|nr:tRNA (adenosine(37)-N6)-dimethylallyltransferase MiaA [Algoriphagus zhangzhouensis]TDY48422.1 tRNA dimethylallyltransferase [Algoriphagus zhangzhouensis]SHO59469.1 tRNA dimethylallyltransferase [Algoriphagus zhangzhouensis]
MDISEKPILILVVGPTAVGKTNLCLNLAKKFDTEIISCDSRQFYREMNLGTAKPTREELNQVPHHMINSHSIEENYDVKSFEEDALELLDQLFQKHKVVIMTGGSGLFADAVTEGMDEMPEIPAGIREEVIKEYQEKGLKFLQNEVKRLDPEYFEIVDQQNPQRLMRALEVCRGTGKTFSSFRVKSKIERPFETIKIGLNRDRDELYSRIDLRMDQMVEAGLFEEAESLFDKRHLNSLQTVGYQEIFGALEGKYDREEAIRLLKRNSRRYAKRQLTWFRRDEKIYWFHPDQEDEIIAFIENQIS